MFDNSAHQVFLEKAYREVFGLLVEVRDYVAGPSKEDGAALLPQDRAMLVHELTKITRRLTDAMAWLLLQKAVAAEEFATEEAARYAAGKLSLQAVAEDGADGAVAEDGTGGDLGMLPLVARGQIDRSRRIFADVKRLEASLRAAADG